MRKWPGGVRVATGLSFAGFLACLAGCATSVNNDPYFMKQKTTANVYVRQEALSFKKVAMMPFKAPTELIGSSISDLFVTEMLRTERYDMVERSQIAKVLGETELAMSGLSSSKAVEAAKMVGAEAVIIGTVDEYSMMASGGKTYATVGISARLIDCNSGQVVWTVDLAKRAKDKTVTLSQHAREIVHEMTSALYQKLSTQKVVPRSSAVSTPAAIAGAADVIPATSTAMAGADTAKSGAAVVSQIDKPSGLQLSDMGLREVTVKWSRVPDYLKECRIERASAVDGPFNEIARVAASKTEYCDRGSSEIPLKDGTAYYYRIIAIAANGPESQPSDVKESMTAPPPDPPAGMKAEAPSSRALKLTWNPPSSEGVVRYIVERGLGGQFEKVGEVKEPKFEEGGKSDSPLKDKTRYQYRVTSINRVGAVGAPSAPVDVETLPPPAPVQGFKAEQGYVRCVPLSWTASPEQDVVHYDLFRKDGQDGESKKLASVKGRENTTYLDGGKEPGKLLDAHGYSYSIRAVNSVTAESPDSETITATTRGAPPVPTGLSAEAGKPREVPLTWTLSPDEKVSGYAIFRAESGSDQFAEIKKIEGRETATWLDRDGVKPGKGLGNLKDGTEYQYKVCAENIADVRSELCECVKASTKKAPATPSIPETSAKEVKAISLVWQANPEKDIDSYVVEAMEKGSSKFREVLRVKMEEGITVKGRHEKLDDGVTYSYRIKAVDKDGLESVWSGESTGTTKPRPDTPAELKSESSAGGLVIKWSPPPQSDIKEYKVFEKGMFRSKLLMTVDKPECVLTQAQAGNKIKITVSSIDTDGLESDVSQPLVVGK
ncbi:MAG: CsgG/HfaB family protein [Kiritimatiellae bacterium]|nr:CsgG/HfaB family protein [Kiritimatiellia bacterium]MDD5523368.1 CsgG/HfaB family protein [Kiritimatiellia bacterium]